MGDLVIGWLNEEADEQLKSSRTPSYRRYIDVVTRWGSPYGLTAVDVEERIFRILRDDGVG